MSREIAVLAEHRKGELRDITFEMLAKARVLGREHAAEVTVLLLGRDVSGMAEALSARADRVVTYEHPRLGHFNSEIYGRVLAAFLRERRPLAMLIGHTSYGIELAPWLATQVGVPLITDVTAISLEDGTVVAERPIYGGKAKARLRSKEPGTILTVESGAFQASSENTDPGRIESLPASEADAVGSKRFIEYVDPPQTDVDIAQSDIVVSVGRGIGDPENLPMVEQLARALGGALAGSRPVIDKKWLPKSRQVGISGKEVRPKLYLAVGISGAFQHLVGIKRAGMVVAINKDRSAPIFRRADYCVVADLFDVVPALTERLSRQKEAA